MVSKTFDNNTTLTYLIFMNARHKKTLATIRACPVNNNIEWVKVEALFVALGCKVIEGSGSRVTFEKDGIRASFHRPHPQKEAKRYQVKDAKDFLQKIGE